ncbi:MAG: hypothetical protein KR126chlam2_00784 [Chlamydiae bacterium]|nr:hypothetical protein [Chlamydiota bacterium]
MTGSGTAFFVMGEELPDLDSAYQIYPTRTIRREPNQWYST